MTSTIWSRLWVGFTENPFVGLVAVFLAAVVVIGIIHLVF